MNLFKPIHLISKSKITDLKKIGNENIKNKNILKNNTTKLTEKKKFIIISGGSSPRLSINFFNFNIELIYLLFIAAALLTR